MLIRRSLEFSHSSCLMLFPQLASDDETLEIGKTSEWYSIEIGRETGSNRCAFRCAMVTAAA
jgi:hypothetical protein